MAPFEVLQPLHFTFLHRSASGRHKVDIQCPEGKFVCRSRIPAPQSQADYAGTVIKPPAGGDMTWM
jgi:hypothetical protein